MARHLHKSWQNKRPGFEYRVRWYEPEFEHEDIRLDFITPQLRTNRYYKTAADAQVAFTAFRISKAIVDVIPL